jgi:signal transduction histidine kinase
MRNLLLELRPKALTEIPFTTLLNQLAASFRSRTDAAIQLDIDCADKPLEPDVQLAMYRIAQEGLNNIIRHSGASQVEIKFSDKPDSIMLTIEDNGRGFDINHPTPGHFGLQNIKERAAMIGADISLTSKPQYGTTLKIVSPKRH